MDDFATNRIITVATNRWDLSRFDSNLCFSLGDNDHFPGRVC